MLRVCERCGKRVEGLVPIDYSSPAVQYTELLGAPYVSTDHVCLDCARVIHEISEEEVPSVEKVRARELEVHAAAFRERVAVMVVETLFSSFGYDVHSLGPEYRVAPRLRLGRRKHAGAALVKLRSSPQLCVHERETNEDRLLKILPATIGGSPVLWLSGALLSSLKEEWPEATLVVCGFPRLALRCRPLEQLDLEQLTVDLSPLTGRYHCRMDPARDLRPLHEEFRRLDGRGTEALLERVWKRIAGE